MAEAWRRNMYNKRPVRLQPDPSVGPIHSVQHSAPLAPPFNPCLPLHNGEYQGPPRIGGNGYGNGYRHDQGYGHGRGQQVGQGRWNPAHGPLVAPHHAPPPPPHHFLPPPPPLHHPIPHYAPTSPPITFAPNGPPAPTYTGPHPSTFNGAPPMHMYAAPPPGYPSVQDQPVHWVGALPPMQEGPYAPYDVPPPIPPPPSRGEGTVSPSGTVYFNGILPLR
ncbi:hypothetical protein OF83DRAFT_360481 [Amylostereum chailletii]|nr:hypothetical protein OF83DRAFT_360481 [Amylostereum chailletii]